MADFKLRIKRKYLAEPTSPQVKIYAQGKQYIIENGKEVEILLPKGQRCIQISCTTSLNGIATTKTEDVRFSLEFHSYMEISIHCGVIIIDKYPTKDISFHEQELTINNANKSSHDINNVSFTNDTFFLKIWNNNSIMIAISAIIFIIACIFLFPSEKLMFIVFLVISEIVAFGALSVAGLDKGKTIFIATMIALVFSILLSLICGIDLYPNGGCPHCNYKGYFGGNGGTIIDCPKC